MNYVTLLGKGTLYGPTVNSNSHMESGSLDAHLFRPIRQRLCSSLKRAVNIVALIPRLFSKGRPTNVLRLVWAVVVDSLKSGVPLSELTNMNAV